MIYQHLIPNQTRPFKARPQYGRFRGSCRQLHDEFDYEAAKQISLKYPYPLLPNKYAMSLPNYSPSTPICRADISHLEVTVEGEWQNPVDLLITLLLPHPWAWVKTPLISFDARKIHVHAAGNDVFGSAQMG
jgi:hypothetical protein